MLRVVIMGERGEGKTSLAIAIGLLLRNLGNDVVMLGHDPNATKHLDSEIQAVQDGKRPSFGFEGKAVEVLDQNLTYLPATREIELVALRQKYEKLKELVRSINDRTADFID